MKSNIVLNKSLDQYEKKYRRRKYRLLKYTKKEIENFDKQYRQYKFDNKTYSLKENNILLHGRKWWLIGDTYYEIPRPIRATWYINLNPFSQVGIVAGALAVIAGISIVTMGLVLDNTGITYTLDKDIKIENINSDIVIDKDSKLPGMTIRHNNEAKHKEGTFKVQAFTDLHLDHKQECCNYTFSMLARNILLEKPDLVVFCGDNVTSSFNKPRTKQFAQLLEDLGVYWAATLGNHEKTPATPNDKGNPYSISRDRMLNIWASYPHCLNKNIKYTTSDGKKIDGVGNCVVNLENESGVTQSLFFLDSNTVMTVAQCKQYEEQLKKFVAMKKTTLKEGQTVFNKDYYDYVKDSQVKWYSETFKTIKDANPNNEPHSTVFSHHPLKEMENSYLKQFNALGDDYKQSAAPNSEIRAFTDYKQDEAKVVSGLYDDSEGFVKNSEYTYTENGEAKKATSHLRRREDMCYSPHDLAYADGETPLFKAIKDAGQNNAFFCGHDHQNNFALKTKGVFMGYIQPACYSSNNLFTTGMLGDDPKVEEEINNGDHLIQGYTLLTYSSNSDQSTKNVLTDFTSKENYYLYPRQDLRENILTYIRKTRSKDYANDRKSYKDKLA